MADRARTGGTSDERLEAWVRLTARGFPYPPTPDLASRRRAGALAPRAEPRARLAWALAAGIVALAALLAVPQTRAALINVLQIGVVRIFLASPTPPLTATPGPTPTLLPPCPASPAAPPWTRRGAQSPSPSACPLTRPTWASRTTSSCRTWMTQP